MSRLPQVGFNILPIVVVHPSWNTSPILPTDQVWPAQAAMTLSFSHFTDTYLQFPLLWSWPWHSDSLGSSTPVDLSEREPTFSFRSSSACSVSSPHYLSPIIALLTCQIHSRSSRLHRTHILTLRHSSARPLHRSNDAHPGRASIIRCIYLYDSGQTHPEDGRGVGISCSC